MFSKQFKIALVLPGFRAGGAEQVVLDLAKCYREHSHDVAILSMSRGGNIQGRFWDCGAKIHEFGFDRQGRKGFSWLMQYQKDRQALFQYFKSACFDIIHVHLSGPDIYCPVPARRAGVKGLFYTFHNTYRQFENNSILKVAKRAYRRNVYKRYDLLFAVDEKVRQWVIDQKLDAPERVETVFNGIDFSRLDCIGSKQDLKKKFGFTEDDIVLLNVGSLTEQKNQKNLIQAIASFESVNGSSVHLLIAGDGPLRGMLAREIKKLNLEKRVHLLGCRNDIPGLLRTADLFIFPSLWEGLPIALLEAIASGTPVAVSKIDAHVNLFANGLSGGLIDGFGPKPISDAIDDFLRDRSQCAAEAEKSKIQVHLKYSSRRMASAYLKFYRQVVEKTE